MNYVVYDLGDTFSELTTHVSIMKMLNLMIHYQIMLGTITFFICLALTAIKLMI